ncbi:MAG: tetraether lipid synthase Tes, partial [Candidatus Thorarchaeota archaeon]
MSSDVIKRTPFRPSIIKRSELPRFGIVRHPFRELPYETLSICPDCLFHNGRLMVIPASMFENDGKVMMRKECSEHGEYEEIVWSDVELYRRAMGRWYRPIGISNPGTGRVDGCPSDCGLCPDHISHTALALIDVTSRCNLTCPICFAGSKASGRFYEPTPEQVLEMLRGFRKNQPVPCPGVQFAGGEPTLNENLKLYIRWAKKLGFDHVMVATNGIRFAEDSGYVRTLVEAGLNTAYLQFDGIDPETYIRARGKDILSSKIRALDSCREAGLDGVILVPTVVRGLNDDQLGDIVSFALKNRDVVKCVNFQPVSITGRIDHGGRERMRITIPEVILLIDEQTGGLVKKNDWHPISSLLPLGRAIGLMKRRPELELSAHFACGMATFLVFDGDGSPRPITQIMDIEGFTEALEEVCDLYAHRKAFAGIRSKLKLGLAFRKFSETAVIRDLISSLLRRGDYDSLADFMDAVIMLGMMHFMDPWNFDLERLKSCDIH